MASKENPALGEGGASGLRFLAGRSSENNLARQKPQAEIAPRSALLALARILGSRDSALRRDELSDWRINGAHGHIYAVPEGFQIFVMGWTSRGWNAAKKALAAADLTNDGDDEGALFLDRLPTAEEAEAIRHWVGVAKKAEFSAEVLTRKRARRPPC
jgi:hypothetical protein